MSNWVFMSFILRGLLPLLITNRLAVFLPLIAHNFPLAEHPHFLPNAFITNTQKPLGIFHTPKIYTRNYNSKSPPTEVIGKGRCPYRAKALRPRSLINFVGSKFIRCVPKIFSMICRKNELQNFL